jgi:N6-adenosine-specific RNA methylase IME4
MSMFDGLPRGGFPTIVADVPSKYFTRSAKGLGRSAERHYRTMTAEELIALPVADYAAPDAHLFFWVTGPHMALGYHVPIMRAWGFEPSSLAFVWVKPTRAAFENGCFFFEPELFRMMMGHTTRQNAEFVVLGRRGNPKRRSKSVRQVIPEPAREHSRKPERFYGLVERYADAPILELFGRSQRPGWTVRGDEATKFSA